MILKINDLWQSCYPRRVIGFTIRHQLIWSYFIKAHKHPYKTIPVFGGGLGQNPTQCMNQYLTVYLWHVNFVKPNLY